MELSGIFSQFVAIKDLVTKIHFLYFLIVLIFMDFQEKSNSKQRLYKTLGAVSCFPVAVCFKLSVSSCSNIWQQYLSANLEEGEGAALSCGEFWKLHEAGSLKTLKLPHEKKRSGIKRKRNCNTKQCQKIRKSNKA